MEKILDYSRYLLIGAEATVVVTIFALALAILLSFAAGIARAMRVPVLARVCAVYVAIFRGTSLLLQLFWIFYCLPLAGIEISPYLAGILSIGLNSGAYGSEIVRGALNSVSKGQIEAARALSLGRWQTLFLVALPQAARETVPAFGNIAIHVLKDTALVSLISIADISFQAQQLRGMTYDSQTIYLICMAMYFALAMVLTAGRMGIERKLDISGTGRSGKASA